MMNRTRHKNQASSKKRDTGTHRKTHQGGVSHQTDREFTLKLDYDDQNNDDALWDGMIDPVNPGDEDRKTMVDARFEKKYRVVTKEQEEKRKQYLAQKNENHRAAELRLARKNNKEVKNVEEMKAKEIHIGDGVVTYTPKVGTLRKSQNVSLSDHVQNPPKEGDERPLFKRAYIEERRSTANATVLIVDRDEFLQMGAQEGYKNLPKWTSNVTSSSTEFCILTWTGEAHTRVRQALKHC